MTDQEGDADVVAARIAVGLGVDSDEAETSTASPVSSAASRTAASCTVSPTSQSLQAAPTSLERFAAATNQDDPVLGGNHHVDHQLRRLRSCQRPASLVILDKP